MRSLRQRDEAHSMPLPPARLLQVVRLPVVIAQPVTPSAQAGSLLVQPLVPPRDVVVRSSLGPRRPPSRSLHPCATRNLISWKKPPQPLLRMSGTHPTIDEVTPSGGNVLAGM